MYYFNYNFIGSYWYNSWWILSIRPDIEFLRTYTVNLMADFKLNLEKNHFRKFISLCSCTEFYKSLRSRVDLYLLSILQIGSPRGTRGRFKFHEGSIKGFSITPIDSGLFSGVLNKHKAGTVHRIETVTLFYFFFPLHSFSTF